MSNVGPFSLFSLLHGLGKGLGSSISKIDAPGGFSPGPPVKPVNNTAIVGAPYDAGGADGNGLATNWLNDDVAWLADIALHGSDGDLGDAAGTSVDLSGETAVIGAPTQGVPGNAPGAAYVFTRDSITGIWSQQAKLVGSDALDGEGFGISVSIDGDTIAAGKYSPAGTTPGAVYIFTRTAGVWTQVTKVQPGDSANGDLFGIRVVLLGLNLFVTQSSDPNGAVYWFTGAGAVWTQQQKLEGANPGDVFGAATSWDGTTLAVGSPGANASAGLVSIFTIIAGVLTLYQNFIGSDTVASDQFGTSTAVSGSVIAVGARNNAVHGAAYVFVFGSSGTWAQTQRFVQPDPTAGVNYYGAAVSLFVGATSWLAVGAPARGGALGVGPGAAYYYQALPVVPIDPVLTLTFKGQKVYAQ